MSSRAAVSIPSSSSLMSRLAPHFAPLVLIVALTPIGQAVAQVASAAPTPGAGDMLREVPVAPTMPALPEVPPLESQAPVATAPAVSFVLREFNLRGNTVLTQNQISLLTDPYMGKPMTEKELSALLAALRQRYDGMGYTLVGIGFPTQDVSKGVLNVDVVEPKLARVQLPEAAGAPVTPERVKGLLSFFCLHAGGTLNTGALERVMFALNDTPGVQAKATLTPAGDEGVYNLAIEMQPRRSWDASVGVDNHGIEYAGNVRTTGMVRWNNPLGIGDNIDVQGLLSNTSGVRVGRASYELPVFYTPARFSMAFARVGYSLGGTFKSLDAFGTARVFETNLTYPLMRSRSRTLMVRLGTESKNLTDHYGDNFGGDIRNDKRVLSTVAGLNYESRDGALGGGFNGAAVNFYQGHLDFKDPLSRSTDDGLGAYHTAGKFNKLDVQLSRLQAISRAVSFNFNLSHQMASRNLDPAEKMSLGGPRGVRAYATAEGASDDATLVNTELRYWLSPNLTVFALYDWAKGRKSHDTDAANLPSNDLVLNGAGLGLVANIPNWASIKATVAWRGKREPQVDADHSKARLYLQAQHTF